MTRLTVIVDNISMGDIKGEWGLCIFVEHNDKKVLVDTGSSKLFIENLAKLNKDIMDIDYATLSHAHYDHSNGMPAFFELNKKAKFYLRDAVAENAYFKKLFIKKYIGIPKGVLADCRDRIEFVSGDYELFEGAYLIPHKTPKLSKIGKRENMYVKTDKGWFPDDFSHEQSLVLKTGKGLVIINSCSHGGAANIINEVQETFPGEHVYALIGGFHLFNKSEAEIRNVSRLIKETGIDFICTGHCTKDRAYNIMKEELGDKLEKLQVGKKWEF